MRRRSSTWTIGGGLLIAAGLLTLVVSPTLDPDVAAGVPWLADAISAAAVLLFAFGLSPGASVVARRPLGVSSLVVVALWPLADRLAVAAVAGSASGPESAGALTAMSYVSLLVPVAAGLIAAVQIGRAGVVTGWVSWAPLAVLVAQAAVFVVTQAGMLAAPATAVQSLAPLIVALGTGAGLLGTLGLGVAALVAAAAQRPPSVVVFDSTAA